jgi:hypothetical protein
MERELKEKAMKTKTITMLSVITLIGTFPVRADIFWDGGYHMVIDGDEYGEIFMQNDAVADILGGSIIKLETWDFSLANIYAGEIDWLFTNESSIINIYGGKLDWLGSWTDSSVNVYAYDVVYHPTGGGVYGNKAWIEGTYFIENIPFSFLFYNEEAYSHVNIVPEPSTFFLLCLGYMLVRRRY